MKNKNFPWHILFTAIMVVVVLGSFSPLIWMTMNAMKSKQEIFLNPLSLPKALDFSIFSTAWEKADFTTALINSLYITAVSVVLIITVSALSAFAFAFLKFKGSKQLFLLILSAQIVSGQVILIPLFVMFKNMNLLDNPWSVIITYVSAGIPLSTILFRNGFREISFEIFESTKIDGCSSLRFFWQILLPLSKPIIASVAIFQSLFAWNEYLFALSFLRSPEKRTIPTSIPVFFAQWSTDYSSLFAILSIAIIPVLVLYLSLQQYFIKGMTAGAVKG